jgi:hypothetical protein
MLNGAGSGVGSKGGNQPLQDDQGVRGGGSSWSDKELMIALENWRCKPSKVIKLLIDKHGRYKVSGSEAVQKEVDIFARLSTSMKSSPLHCGTWCVPPCQ